MGSRKFDDAQVYVIWYKTGAASSGYLLDADIESSQIFHSRIMGKLIMMLFGGACLEKS